MSKGSSRSKYFGIACAVVVECVITYYLQYMPSHWSYDGLNALEWLGLFVIWIILGVVILVMVLPEDQW